LIVGLLIAAVPFAWRLAVVGPVRFLIGNINGEHGRNVLDISGSRSLLICASTHFCVHHTSGKRPSPVANQAVIPGRALRQQCEGSS
jgi:hypothetical protein